MTKKTSSSRTCLRILIIIAGGTSLCGCGTYIPTINEPLETAKSAEFSPAGLMEYKLKRKVYCDIAEAVRGAKLLPKDWAVQMTLDLQVDETGALTPGVSIIDPLSNMQSVTYAFGAVLSSQATHEDKFSSYWELSKIIRYSSKDCSNPDVNGSSPLLTNNLRIKEWLQDASNATFFLPSSELTKKADSTAFKQDSLTYHTKFIVITSANFNPSWKLLRISANTGNTPLANVNRTRTHDLLLTFGPAFKAGQPDIAGDSHLSAEIGIAVSNGNRLQQEGLPY